MKNLKYLLIQPELGLWNHENNTRIRDESRSLGVFLERRLKEEKIKAETFHGIYIKSAKKSKDPYCVNNLLILEIDFPEESYPAKENTREINEYLISRLKEGMLRIQEEYPEIVAVILQGVEEFRRLNYECTWVHKKKKLGGGVIRLRCVLNVKIFNLYLEFINKNQCIMASKLILETSPNEYSFKHKFRDLIIEKNGDIVVTDFLHEEWYRLNPSNLG
ncbi:hypothetical protein [Acinetobacter sp. 1000160]|uniref:hypothetical protein n=1 Tax=Acinetobacter sp. 1000160 TaxID=1310800 RepID=UPI000446FB5F|nr:hypothetical protein [Acinetobacter sp. 1000160]EXB48611.1 hypothetical protein J522_0185 [Acinetobacter baumannii 146457]EYT22889.1 hypothetical protein J699_00961 [Acinetobacter sp. 1000160]